MFAQLAFLVALGLLGPVLCAGKLRIAPVLLGELIAGAVAGRTGFRILDPAVNPFPIFFAVGFAMLMFSAGTHVNLHSAELRANAARGGVAVVAALALAAPIGWFISLALGVGHPSLLVVLLAGSSAAITFPILEERGLKGPTVSFLAAWIVLADVATVVLMPLTLTGPGHLLLALTGDALIIGIGVLIVLVGRALLRPAVVDSAIRESLQRGWALQLRVAMLMLLVLAALAERTQASLLLAGFAAGMVLAWLRAPGRLDVQLSGLGNGFFVPAFFVLLGASLDLRILVQNPGALGLAVAMGAGSVVVHLVASVIAGGDRRLGSGLLASAQLGLPAAAAALGMSTGSLHPALAAAIVAGGCLTLIPTAIGVTLLSRGVASRAPDGAQPE